MNFYSFTDLSEGSARQRWLCVCLPACVYGFFCFNAFPRQKRSINMGREATSTYSTKGWGCKVLGAHPPPPLSLPAGFGVTLCPSPSALWPVVQMGRQHWGAGGGVQTACPWCINQKALLARVFSSTLSLFTQNALEDYLLPWGWNGSVLCAGTSPILMLAVLENLPGECSFFFFSPHCMKTGISGSLNCECCCHISGFTMVRIYFHFF